MEWHKNEFNEFLEGEGFHISYNPNPDANPENRFYNLLGSFVGLSTKGEETALVLHEGKPKYRVLNGDFRKEYEAAVPLGLEACVEVYEKHKATNRSDWSMDDVEEAQGQTN